MTTDELIAYLYSKWVSAEAIEMVRELIAERDALLRKIRELEAELARERCIKCNLEALNDPPTGETLCQKHAALRGGEGE
jgi:hypothetical protein